MKPRRNGNSDAQSFRVDGPNWMLIAGGALLSTLSVRLGYKLKQVLDTRRLDNATSPLKGSGKSNEKRRSGACALHSNMYSFTQDEDVCYSCLSGTSEGMVEVKRPPTGRSLKEADPTLSLVAIAAAPDSNGVMWSSSPDRLEHPRKPFHHSNSSDSPCVSESGSDIFSKREVIHKLRQQLKRRDEMIAEMQDQIMELQSSLSSQLTNAHVLQSQLDAANRDLFDSEREIQRLRKAIADHCVRDTTINHHPQEKKKNNWPENGHANGNGYPDVELSFESGRGDGERIELLRREVGELKEVIEGKDYLLQSYKEQKAELSLKVSDLQQRLVVSSQVPNIL